MRDITNYMTTGAFHLMTHAAENREAWLTRFYKIGKDATRPRKDGEILAYVVEDKGNTRELQEILARADVEYENFLQQKDDGDIDWVLLVKMAQPYSSFAKAILGSQKYPNLKDEKGDPISPYDVTAHTISLLHDAEAKPIYKNIRSPKNVGASYYSHGDCGNRIKTYSTQIYRSYIPSMDEGWTRFILTDKNWKDYEHDCTKFEVTELKNNLIKQNTFTSKTIIFPDQSPNSILNGYKEGSMPMEYTGGLSGKGVENLKKFVEDGGTLVFLNRSSDFAIEQFDLPVKNIAKDWKEKDFYIPGSILRTELDTKHPIAKGMPERSIAWFEDSPVFEVTDNSRVKVIAKYPEKAEDILLSGWALGKEKIAGKAALVEFSMGKGKIILFGFRPQYRGQSLATFPLLFNSIAR